MFNNDERYWDIHKLNKWFGNEAFEIAKKIDTFEKFIKAIYLEF